MDVRCVWEHNGNDSLLYCMDYPGAYTRGNDLCTAKRKIYAEVKSYCAWADVHFPDGEFDVEIVQDQSSTLQICDADSDVIFSSETHPISFKQYELLKKLALKSALDFQTLYDSIPDKRIAISKPRKTFYGMVPRTPCEMYEHTKSVNSYYFSEMNVPADNDGTIFECRARGFMNLEKVSDFLNFGTISGSYDEIWSVHKVMRRFIWHDRIHAKAMYRMAVQLFGDEAIDNPFHFNI